MLRLTRRQDAIVDRFRRAARRAAAEPCVLLDGEHLVEDAVAAGVPIDVAIATQERWHAHPALVKALRLQTPACQLFEAAPTVIEAASPVKTPSGIAALAHWQPAPLATVFQPSAPLVVAAVDVQDPGNFGAIVRSADALGATGVVAAGATADPAGWKALRGAMGSSFRVPVARATTNAVMDAAREAGCRVLAATLDGEAIDRCDLRSPTLLLVGSEGLGLPAEAINGADQRASVIMRPGVNSLNVAVTAALLLYEARRQRT